MLRAECTTWKLAVKWQSPKVPCQTRAICSEPGAVSQMWVLSRDRHYRATVRGWGDLYPAAVG